MPTPAQAKQWEEVQPGTFDRIMSQIDKDEGHRRRLDLLEFGSKVFGQVCGLCTVAILALLAKYFVDQGAPTQGASIIITGAVGIVTIFVTNRRWREK